MLLRKSLESLKKILVHCSENWLTVVELLEKWLSYRPDLGTLCYLVQHCFILAIVSKTLEAILNSQLLGMAIASVELKHTHSNPSDHVARVVRHPPLRHLFLEVELLLQVDVQNGGDVFFTVSSHKRTAEGGPPGKSN